MEKQPLPTHGVPEDAMARYDQREADAKHLASGLARGTPQMDRAEEPVRASMANNMLAELGQIYGQLCAIANRQEDALGRAMGAYNLPEGRNQLDSPEKSPIKPEDLGFVGATGEQIQHLRKVVDRLAHTTNKLEDLV